MSKFQCQIEYSKKSGFTLIEALVVLFVFSIITLTFYSVFSLGSRYIIESKNRLGAVALANEKMEIIRNLNYDDIGIVGGIPSGNILAEEDVVESKRAYHIKTFVQFIDDPLDGISPGDTDYKSVKITVSWDGVGNADSSFFLVARFVPPGVEQNAAGGTLAINVMGSGSNSFVPQALVHITNNDISPAVNLTVMTDNTGNVMIPGIKQSILGYHISIAKQDYEYVETIDPSAVTYSVTDIPASVIDGEMNSKSFVVDRVVNLKIVSMDMLGNQLPDVSFHLAGGRILGYDMMQSPAEPVYNLITDASTDANGEKEFNDISPSQFFISDIEDIADYTLVGLDSFSSFKLTENKYGLIINAGDSKEVKIKFANNNENSLLLQVLEMTNENPLSDAHVELTNNMGYSEDVITSIDGVAFMPSSSGPLVSGEYNLRITADGFHTYESAIELDKLVKQQIKLLAE